MRKTTEKEQEKNTENQEHTEKRTEKIIIQNMASVSNELKEYKEFMASYVNNPFYFTSENNIINIKVELKEGFLLPYFISRIMFGNDVVVKEIEIKGSDIYIYYHNKGVETSILDRYIINLDWARLPIKDLFMLVFIMRNMPREYISDILLRIQELKDYVRQEKDVVIKMLKDNGIEINN